MTDRTRRPTDSQIVSRALALLAEGLLPSALPGRLMDEFGLTPDRAGALAEAVMKRRKRRRLATRPLDQPGES